MRSRLGISTWTMTTAECISEPKPFILTTLRLASYFGVPVRNDAAREDWGGKGRDITVSMRCENLGGFPQKSILTQEIVCP